MLLTEESVPRHGRSLSFGDYSFSQDCGLAYDFGRFEVSIDVRGHSDGSMTHEPLCEPYVDTFSRKIGAVFVPEAVGDEIIRYHRPYYAVPISFCSEFYVEFVSEEQPCSSEFVLYLLVATACRRNILVFRGVFYQKV